MDPEILRDLLDRHTGLPATGHAHGVVAELPRVGLGHSYILPDRPKASQIRCHPVVQQSLPMREGCASDRYLAVAMTHDPHAGEGWPHWMQHGLRELMNELRTELLIHVIERPHGDGAVEDYFRGTGLIPKARQSATTRAAVQIVSDHGTVVDLWLRDRLSNLGAWPERVGRAALRSASAR